MRIGDVMTERRRSVETTFVVGTIKGVPSSIGEDVFVIVDTLDTRFEWGPFPWRPRGEDGDDWPSRGDTALIGCLGSRRFLIDWYPRD